MLLGTLKKFTISTLPLLFLIVSLLASFTEVSIARLVDATAAIVNNEVITLSDVKRYQSQQKIRREIDPFIAYFNFNPQSNREIIDYLIQENIVVQRYPTAKNDIDEEIISLQKKNNIDEEALRDILKGEGVNFETYQQLMGISISKRKLIDRELRPVAVVSEDEIKNHYYTASAFIDRKKKQKLLLSYDLSQIRIQDRALSQEIHNKLKAGEDFEATANKYIDRGVRLISLGTLREDNLAASIRDSLEGLKVGENTQPVSIASDGVYVIHKVNAISAPHDPVFEREKVQIHNILTQKALVRQLQLWTERETNNSTFIHRTDII